MARSFLDLGLSRRVLKDVTSLSILIIKKGEMYCSDRKYIFERLISLGAPVHATEKQRWPEASWMGVFPANF
jgi:hypothetical protein